MHHIPRHHDASLGYFTYEDCCRMNVKFALALLAARRRGEEKSFSLGPLVNTSHVDYAPRRYIGETIWSPMGSSAALCADESGRDEEGWRVGRSFGSRG